MIAIGDSDSDDVNIDDSDLQTIIENENFFANKKGKMSKTNCIEDKDCKKYDSDSYCYKNKCLNIHKRCKVSKIKKCLKRTYSDDGKECCDKKSKCVSHIDNNGIKNEICIKKDKLEKAKIGDNCESNSDCKSTIVKTKNVERKKQRYERIN